MEYMSPNPQTDHGMVWLVKHAWQILTQSFGKGRISRGELWIASLLLTVIVNLVWLLLFAILQFGGNEMILFWSVMILSVINLVIQLWLLITRAHDLDKSWWWILKMIGLSILIVLWVWIVMSFVLSILRTSGYNIYATQMIVNLSLWILTLAAITMRGIVPLIKLYFYKGTPGDNTYGPDPLAQDQVSNTYYRVVGSILAAIGLLFSVWSDLILWIYPGWLKSIENIDLQSYKANLTGEDLAQFEQMVQNYQLATTQTELEPNDTNPTLSQTGTSAIQDPTPTTSGTINS